MKTPLDSYGGILAILRNIRCKYQYSELHVHLAVRSMLSHPPYIPDLAPCDFFLFLNLKKSLAGQKFATNEEVVAGLEITYFSDGLKKLEHRWVKCIELKEDNVEK